MSRTKRLREAVHFFLEQEGTANTVEVFDYLNSRFSWGATMNQVGNISAPEPRLLTVSVWDAAMAPMVEKAIRESDLGLNPATEGNLIRVPIPDLSEERRRDMVKVAGRYAEGCRVAIRNIRRDSIEKIRKAEKDGLISEDHRHTQENHVQKLTDEFVKKVDDALSQKERDITHV